tara:strand:- start:344 stop:1426 length:1083 start_codon:yes stop_codon:yes gene_type:complete
MILKKYENYLIKLYLKNLLLISLVFIFLSFFLNIFEEIKFVEEYNDGILYPVILTFLNIPSIVFEIIPFIFLISAMFFFINLYDKDEIDLLRVNGINNLKITFIVSGCSLLLGVLLIFVYYSFSSNLKNLYLNLKYKFTENNDHLAVVNESGLWIKEKTQKYKFIINAKQFKNRYLEGITISQLNNDYQLINTIVAKKADIKSNNWKLHNVTVYSEGKNDTDYDQYYYKSLYNEKIISNLYSNLTSLNIFELNKLKNNYESIGYSSTDIKLHLNKLYSLPLYLMLTTIIGSLIMFRYHFIKSKFFLLVIGVIVSVIFYYLNYFATLFGENQTIPAELSIWLPQLLILLTCTIGLVRINEK